VQIITFWQFLLKKKLFIKCQMICLVSVSVRRVIVFEERDTFFYALLNLLFLCMLLLPGQMYKNGHQHLSKGYFCPVA